MFFDLKDIGKCPSCCYSNHSTYDPSPHGVSLSSGYFEEWDCGHPDVEQFDSLEEYDCDWGNTEPCLFWRPIEVRICTKHGMYLDYDGCPECRNEAEARADKEAQEYWDSITHKKTGAIR